MDKTFKEKLEILPIKNIEHPVGNTKYYAAIHVKSLIAQADKEFQELFDKYSNLNDNYEEEVIRSSKLESQIIGLKSQLQQQALPVVPEDVAKLPPFNDMKEYVLDERLLIIREYLNKLDDKSNSDITEAEAWCMIHEDIAYRAMLDGYTVEKPQLFEVEFLTDNYDRYLLMQQDDEEPMIDVESTNEGYYKQQFTEQEIKSINEKYMEFAVPVEDGE